MSHDDYLAELQANYVLEELTGRLMQLREQLETALGVYEFDDQRLGLLAALRAVTEFVDGFDKLHALRLSKPFLDLAGALLDADRGVSNPLLQPVPRTGRPPATMEYQSLWVYSSIAMQLLMDAGCSKEEAARTVARRLEKLRVKIGASRGTAIWQTVANWRERVTSDEFLTIRYRKLLDRFRETGLDPQKAAENLLSSLREGINLRNLQNPPS